MIVPRNKLIFWTAVVLLPCALLAALLPGTADIMIGIGVIYLCAIALDAVLALGFFRGIEVQMPEVAHLSCERDGEFEFVVHNKSKKSIGLRLGLCFPPEIESSEEVLAIQLPEDKEHPKFRWTCRPLNRGKFHFQECFMERQSPFGFWDFRTRSEIKMEARVYPNLLLEARNLSALFLNHGNIGSHRLRMVGKGREFEKLREYIPGDSYEDIHWKASAKRGRPVTKIFQTERTQEVYVLVDASRLSARSADSTKANSHETQLERFINAALIMGLACEKQGDNFGVLTFSDQIHSFIRAKNGKANYGLCRDALYTLTPRIVSPDYDELFRFIRTRITKRALLLILTNLDDPVLAESFEHNVQLISRQHLVLTNMLVPGGCQPLFESKDVRSLRDVYQALGGHQRWFELKELQQTLKRQGVDFHLLEEAGLCTDVVSQYMAVKQRQVL